MPSRKQLTMARYSWHVKDPKSKNIQKMGSSFKTSMSWLLFGRVLNLFFLLLCVRSFPIWCHVIKNESSQLFTHVCTVASVVRVKVLRWQKSLKVFHVCQVAMDKLEWKNIVRSFEFVQESKNFQENWPKEFRHLTAYVWK